MELARGANTVVEGTSLKVAVNGSAPGTVDLMVFQLDERNEVRDDADFVFFNQPVSPEGAVRLESGGVIEIDIARLPADIHQLSVAVALDAAANGTLSAVGGLGVVVEQVGSTAIAAQALGLTSERAAVLVEIYRRGTGWKLRNVSAGWDSGLADLVTAFGVSVDEEPPARPAGSAESTGGIRTVPDEAKLSMVKREKLDLRKREVAKVLLTKGGNGIRARVVLVIDKTGSMAKQYRTRVVHRVVERMIPVAIQLDDDGKLEPYLYAVSFVKLPEISVHDAEEWSDTYLHLRGSHGGFNYDKIGAANREVPIMTEILSGLTRGSAPTLVLFFTDGGFSERKEITKLMREASGLPAFWQFVGIGKANYGVLEKLDDLDGRVVDNAGFFALDDIDTVDDAQLYTRLLSEFPDWHKAAVAAGITTP
ncbi:MULTISPECIES: VWA domain-containing protein [unclassified Rhodococcus (in: high G+C Gram-positive bacteria)]|uniref:vWA domain-containing protein n=1 Tax=unclassified Rhodococcus (in: high G+C Gram-positive bacteria) TaxID=192944 RepID=UPI001C4E5306|nr:MULTISPECIES: VWA domain-containing protein [unclassified Rhodococcus (in: high G+C Gram-positive bacteria)]MBQ9053670.1 VWA domain-containing protein [Rhodococcus sp. (in: high G+C Gram-positive bacteria)]MBW0293653.1 stress protein [Rhodococcus sp. MH15]